MLRSVFAPYGQIPGSWPTGITQTRGPNGTYLDPHYDAQLGAPLTRRQKRKIKQAQREIKRDAKRRAALGAIPTDFEMAQQYTPVTSGWIATGQGYLTPPWLPPYGHNQGRLPVQPNDGGGRPESPLALRFYTPERARDPQWNTTLGDGAPVESVVDQMNKHNDRVFALALVSTTAVAISAVITVFRTLRLIRKD